MRSSTQTLIEALRILSIDIQSEDGIANACIAEATDRLEELYNLTKGQIDKVTNLQEAVKVAVDGLLESHTITAIEPFDIEYQRKIIDEALTKINELVGGLK